jgi:hypothetical protein
MPAITASTISATAFMFFMAYLLWNKQIQADAWRTKRKMAVPTQMHTA